MATEDISEFRKLENAISLWRENYSEETKEMDYKRITDSIDVAEVVNDISLSQKKYLISKINEFYDTKYSIILKNIDAWNKNFSISTKDKEYNRLKAIIKSYSRELTPKEESKLLNMIGTIYDVNGWN